MRREAKLVHKTHLLSRVTFFGLLLTGFAALGWFFYPSAWQSAPSPVPEAVRRLIWGEALFVGLCLTRMCSTWVRVYRANHSLRHTLDLHSDLIRAFRTATVTVGMFLMFAVIWAGAMTPTVELSAGTHWGLFTMFTLTLFAAISKALDVRLVVDSIIKATLHSERPDLATRHGCTECREGVSKKAALSLLIYCAVWILLSVILRKVQDRGEIILFTFEGVMTCAQAVLAAAIILVPTSVKPATAFLTRRRRLTLLLTGTGLAALLFHVGWWHISAPKTLTGLVPYAAPWLLALPVCALALVVASLGEGATDAPATELKCGLLMGMTIQFMSIMAALLSLCLLNPYLTHFPLIIGILALVYTTTRFTFEWLATSGLPMLLKTTWRQRYAWLLLVLLISLASRAWVILELTVNREIGRPLQATFTASACGFISVVRRTMWDGQHIVRGTLKSLVFMVALVIYSCTTIYCWVDSFEFAADFSFEPLEMSWFPFANLGFAVVVMSAAWLRHYWRHRARIRQSFHAIEK